MRSLIACFACLIAILTCQALAQTGGTGRARSGRQSQNPANTPPPPAFLSGKVALDDGTPLTEPVGIQTICLGQKRTVAHTDMHGSFSFQIGTQPLASGADTMADAETAWTNPTPPLAVQNDWRNCQLQATLPGFSSDVVELSSQRFSSESIDLGRIVLHRIGQVQGFTISATSAMAPDEARKAYAKGMENEKKNKLDTAGECFTKAVKIYPRYAVAWVELGRLQRQRNDSASARQSFQHAVQADPKFVIPYEELAQLTARDQRWPEVVEITEKLTALNPLLPRAWFINAVAHYNLQQMAEAEKSVREGLKLDDEHRTPRMEYLLAAILVEKHELAEAAEHLRAYLQLAPKAEDADAARRQLAQITKPSAASATPPAADK
jgi:TolA-binding protein